MLYTQDNEKKPKQIKRNVKPQNSINENKKKQTKQMNKTNLEQISIKKTKKEESNQNSFFDGIEDLTEIKSYEPVQNKPKKQQ